MAGKSPCEAAFVHQGAGNRSVKSRLKVPLHGTVVATWSGRLFLIRGNGQKMELDSDLERRPAERWVVAVGG